jgi:sigma-54 dependent transcriptional regulator, acetoin dehydrogenase operon transcriptional activator AcoR
MCASCETCCGGNLTLAARRLHIAKSTLYAKMQRYGLSREGACGVRH